MAAEGSVLRMMELRINPEPSEIMHVDLNSAFAMAEQQANPLLRGKPVGITNRNNDFAICITSSYEARKHGVGVGTRLREARLRAPGFVMVESDSAKYGYINKKMRAIFESYSPVSYMKSVDEGIIDFRGMRGLLKGRSLEDVGRELKQRVHEEVGDYMTVNVGIAQNRWLAKVAAGFLKPDGLYMIGPDNLEVVYGMMDLVELPYIKQRNKLRLNEAGIYTALDFFRASEAVLTKQVFRGVNGHHWYLKLRGYETEVEYGIRTVGRSYVLEHRTADPEELATLLYKAAVKVARRLRKNNLAARGLMLRLTYARQAGPGEEARRNRMYGQYAWGERRMYRTPVRRADQLYQRALELFWRGPRGEVVASMAMTAYAVEPARTEQLALYESEDVRQDRIEDAMNIVNDRYGELTLVPAAVMKSKNPMPDKVPFGSVRYFD
ncbi:MAG: Nucleotidyltransferase/DNA polymerase involved in repair [Patescibacteria group bacterium]|nr:Nucleotidyltransferase/DNA polymerase involved in repair [Patescibacteria group bacterium]